MVTTIVKNVTRNTILAQEAQIADSPLTRMKGLLGRKGLTKGQGMVIIPCSSIHTFFMKFAIDVLFIDNNNRVVSMAKSLPPWRLFKATGKAKMVVELPSGVIETTMTKSGDSISVE